MPEDQSVNAQSTLPHHTTKQVDGMAPLQFQTLASQPTPTFWSALNTLKLDKLKLDDAQQPISGWLEEGREVIDKENGDRRVGVDGSLGVGGSSFGEGSEK
jgi:ubiquitin-like modifier-activating enzyme ATG7